MKKRTFLAAIAGLLMLPMVASAQFPTPTKGWNLGNTLEAPTEGAWAPPATQAMINKVAASGFNTIRIPVALASHADRRTYVIDPAWLARIKTVVDWSLAANLTVIIENHTDGGWFDGCGFRRYNSTLNSQFISYWTQIGNYFNSYDSRLIFGAANEPGISTQAQADVLKQYYQNFINTIRGQGGNNATRWLVLPGDNTDVDRTVSFFTLPSDPANRLIVDVHYYAPWQFCGQGGTNGTFYFWGNGYHTANSALLAYNTTYDEESYVAGQMQKLKTKFPSTPVMIGEFASLQRTGYANLTGTELQRHLASRTYFNKTVADTCRLYGIAPFFWDNGWNGTDGMSIFDRTTATVTDQGSVTALTGGPAVLPPP